MSRTTSKKFKRYEPPSPSYCSEDELERDEYFIGNPEYEFDELPQPFRLIDRILQEIYDNVSEEIEKVEELRELLRAAKPVPIFKSPALLDCSALNEGNSSPHVQLIDSHNHGYVDGAINVSSTENFIFVAKGKFILAMSSVTKVALAQIRLDTQREINLLQSLSISTPASVSPVIAIFAFDCLGHCFSFVYNNKTFIPIQALDESKAESSKVVKWQYCSDSNLVCLVRQLDSSEHFVEVYRVPKEQWINDFQNILGKQEDYVGKDNNEELTTGANESYKDISGTVCQEGEDEDFGSSLLQKSSNSISASHVSHMILSATVNLPKAAPCTNFQSALKMIETGKIGSGNKHCLSSSFFESLKQQINKDLSNLGLSSDSDTYLQQAQGFPTVHFLRRINSKDLKSSSSDEAGCFHEFLGIWWSNRNNFMIYKIPRSSKDGDFQIEVVYPNADVIIRSCVNEETDLIALMIKNGNTVVWNRASGEPSRIIQFDNIKPVFMEFASVSRNAERLLIGDNSGTIQEVDCSGSDFDIHSLIDKSLVEQNEIISAGLVPGCQFLLFVARKPNFITIFNLEQRSAVFHFQLPGNVSLDSSVSVCFKFSEDLSSIIVHGKKLVQFDYHLHGLFIFNFSIDDADLLSNTSSVTSPVPRQNNKLDTLETVALSLMEEINGKRKEREARRKLRWKEYVKELENRN